MSCKRRLKSVWICWGVRERRRWGGMRFDLDGMGNGLRWVWDERKSAEIGFHMEDIYEASDSLWMSPCSAGHMEDDSRCKIRVSLVNIWHAEYQ